MSEERPDHGEIVSFSSFISNLDEGGLHHDLTAALVDIVAGLNDARENGTANPKAGMTVKLSFSLDGQTIDVVGDFTTKLPKVQRERSVFWTTAKNRLSRSNPKQQSLPFKSVDRTDDVKAV